ncbi:nucleolar pre-ribosomal-associated protein 1 [Tachyglossus aculeatus]|uniref:nucleolar pre-ribosomal-associated protein 1 n=1 Tax=Tachyglossus aculeatus TaxID=9261 RepID=UPI0018F45F3F|nr:nucleolar pre-ribosomal-associated protein 1 [Tachyglossus aculeatus]
MGGPGRKRKEPHQDPPGKRPPPAAAAAAASRQPSGLQLKAQLRDPESGPHALEAFVSTARKLPQAGLRDVVEEYIKISVECAEIFQLFGGEKRPEREMLLVLQALEAILLRTASDLAHLRIVGTNIVKTLIHNHMKVLYASLFASGYQMSRACLNLMSAMVAQGPDAARDVYSHFDFNKKPLQALVTKRNPKGLPDVRMAYVQFALSFLIAGDDNTIAQVLELKDFIPAIFSTGLKEDRISTINLLLSTLGSKVVHNKSITKTQKVRFFTGQVLNHLASLYRWNGIQDVSTEDIQDTEGGGKAMVREMTHTFLMDLCCSLKHGINFYDASLGTAGRGGNLSLLHFLLGLKTAPEDELVADLVVNILKVCPDLLHKYFKEVNFSFVPRLKSAWLNNIRLLTQIYEAQPEVSRAFDSTEFIPPSRLLSMVMVTTVPAVCSKAMFTQGLNLENRIVKHTVLTLVSTVLKRALQNIDHCLDQEAWPASAPIGPAAREEFVRLYRESLSKLLPDLNSVVSAWQSLCRQEAKPQDGPAGDRKEPGPTGDLGPEDVEVPLLKAAVLQVLCLYQRTVPHLVLQYNFDFSKLLRGIVTEKGLGQETAPVLQYHILKVALELPASKFSWFRAQEGPDPETAGGERSVFYLLMKMFVTSNHSQLKASTKQLIVKVLRDTGVFEHTWAELELWLGQLDSTADESKETVIQFLESVFLKLVSSPHVYTDKAADFVQEASTLQAGASKQEADSVSLPVSHIDDVLHMVDVLVEDSEDLDQELGVSLTEDMILLTFPFSALVPAALEARNKLLLEGKSATGDSVVNFLVTVGTDLLHTQRDPLALCLLFQAYDQEQPPSSARAAQLRRFNAYYRLWIPAHAQDTTSAAPGEQLPAPAPLVLAVSPPLQGGAFCSLLQEAYAGSAAHRLLEEAVQAELTEAIARLQSPQLPIATKHVLLYLKTSVDNFAALEQSMGPALVRFFLDLLSRLVDHCGQLDARYQRRCEAARAQSDLFVDLESLALAESAGDQTLGEVLSGTLSHPTLSSWFLALERQALPLHSLRPPRVRQLSAQLSGGVLRLLEVSAPLARRLGRLHLLSGYLDAVVDGVLVELRAGRPAAIPLEALRVLHGYLGPARLRAVTQALLELPRASLATKSGPQRERQLSGPGTALVRLLTAASEKEPGDGEPAPLTPGHVRALSALLPALAVDELDAALVRALRGDPGAAHGVGGRVLTYCLDRGTEATLAAAAALIEESATQLLRFELWCLRPDTVGHLRRHVDAFLPLLHRYLQCRARGRPARPHHVESAVTRVLRKALWKRLQCRVLRPGPRAKRAEQGLPPEVLAGLMEDLGAEELAALKDGLPDVLEKEEQPRSWVVAAAVSASLERSSETPAAWRKALLRACARWLVASFGRGEAEEVTRETEESMLSRLQELLHSTGTMDPADWQKLVKAGLRFRYRDRPFLTALRAAIQLLYRPGSSLSQTLVPLPLVYTMVTQHSLFLPTVLRARREEKEEEQEQESPSARVKEAVVDLLVTIVDLCPSVCESSHFAVLLGAYGAGLGTLDQKILLLLRAYEKNDHSLVSFRLLLWGPAAVAHHETCKSLGKSLWQQPGVGEILGLLDRDRMMKTILHFPQNRRLLPAEGSQEPIFTDRSGVDLEDLYDPCFLLHLFSELTRPELVVDCHQFVEANALGLVVTALSSYDPNMRAAAYYVLLSFHGHLEGARFREQSQLLYLLDVVQGGIRSQNLRLTYSLTLFIAKAARQMLSPEEHMYMKINRFLLSHEYLDLNKVPGFYQLFYSSGFEHRAEREWVLEVLRRGMRDKYCYELYASQGIFRILLCFFHSPLCDDVMQNWIVEILQNSARVTKSAYELIRDHSLLTWILYVLEKKVPPSRLLSGIISLVHTLWVTNLGDKGSEGPASQPQAPKLLALHFIGEFLYVLMVLARQLRPGLDGSALTLYLSTLRSVLRHRDAALAAFRALGRFTVSERALSTGDVLWLLHHWSVVDKDGQLQDGLRATAEKYRLTELLRAIKDRNKPLAPARARAQRGRRKAEAADSPAEAAGPSPEQCRSLLRDIVTHWTPEPPVSPPEPAESPSGPELAAASLTARWMLRTLAGPLEARETTGALLAWFGSSILPFPPVAEELLGDAVVTDGLFRLYGRVCRAAGTRGGVAGRTELCLFNSLMLRLLAVRGTPRESSLHAVVDELSRSSESEEDEARQAAAAFLVSLYVKDVWLEVERVDTLRAHVQLICSVEEEEEEGAAVGRKQDPIVALCRDLAATMGSLGEARE